MILRCTIDRPIPPLLACKKFSINNNTRGLSCNKFREQDHNLADTPYQLHGIEPMMDQFTSAPAAFGANESSPPLDYAGEYHHDVNVSYEPNYSLGNYFYDNHYNNEGISGWVPQRYDSGFERNHDYDQYVRDLHAQHVDPSIIHGVHIHTGFIMDSGQTLSLDSAPDNPPNPALNNGDKQSRSAGKPTNIVSNGEMDRKTLKRLRNRVSASRCRVKKKEWINEMEDESNILNHENRKLMKKISALEESIANAKATLQ
jgi:hypothetical protein